MLLYIGGTKISKQSRFTQFQNAVETCMCGVRHGLTLRRSVIRGRLYCVIVGFPGHVHYFISFFSVLFSTGYCLL